MMATRIFRGFESKQTRACAAHDCALLIVKIVSLAYEREDCIAVSVVDLKVPNFRIKELKNSTLIFFTITTLSSFDVPFPNVPRASFSSVVENSNYTYRIINLIPRDVITDKIQWFA